MNKANSIFFNLLLVLISLSFGYYLGKNQYSVKLNKQSYKIEVINKQPKKYDNVVDMSLFWEVWETLNTKHIDKPFNPKVLVRGAIKGLVRAVDDPYTIYLEPSENQNFDEIIKGEYEGIGAELTRDGEFIIVVAPFDGSPAQKAGIKPKDMIVEVGDTNVVGMELSDVVKLIKGPKGTSVKLTILREGSDPKELNIIRDSIILTTVRKELKDSDIAYIRISRFGETTNKEWDEAVKSLILENPNIKSVVLDLRSNPGGLLLSAVHVASEFIPKGIVVKEEYSDGRKQSNEVDHNGLLIGKKLIVLVDKGSASASEILAGALRERAKAILVGTKTFGKGTVQTPLDYKDGSGLNITVGKWLTPEGYWVHKKGLTPDVEIDFTEEDIKNKKDVQLEKALELAR